MIVIDVGTDILPSISLGYEIAEIDVMTRKPRKKTDHLLSIRALTHSYLLMGPISLGGGFVGYYTTFN
jgi:sodium/potassium-transporting ATPase subunit alpha